MQELSSLDSFLQTQLLCRSINTPIQERSLLTISNRVNHCMERCSTEMSGLSVDERKVAIKHIKEVKSKFNLVLRRENKKKRCCIFGTYYALYKKVFNIQPQSSILFSGVKFKKEDSKCKKIILFFCGLFQNKTHRTSSEGRVVPRITRDAKGMLCTLIVKHLESNPARVLISPYRFLVEETVESLALQQSQEIRVEDIQSMLLERVKQEFSPVDKLFTAREMLDVKEEFDALVEGRLKRQDYSYVNYDGILLKNSLKLFEEVEPTQADPLYPMRCYRIGEDQEAFAILQQRIKELKRILDPSILNRCNEDKEGKIGEYLF